MEDGRSLRGRLMPGGAEVREGRGTPAGRGRHRNSVETELAAPNPLNSPRKGKGPTSLGWPGRVRLQPCRSEGKKHIALSPPRSGGGTGAATENPSTARNSHPTPRLASSLPYPRKTTPLLLGSFLREGRRYRAKQDNHHRATLTHSFLRT